LIAAIGRRIIQSQGVFLNEKKPTLNFRYIPIQTVISETTIQVPQKTLSTQCAIRDS
jgi:hypothetical protein